MAETFPPIPDYTEVRRDKPSYDASYPIDAKHPLHNDRLIDLRELGFEDASSYFAQPENTAGNRLPIPDMPLVRLDIGLRLLKAEIFLATDREVREALGATAHLRIDDAYRPVEAQQFAWAMWQGIVRQQHPEWDDEAIDQEVAKYCGQPMPGKATPHLTGGAVDVALVNAKTGEPFDIGHQRGALHGTSLPEYYETHQTEVPGHEIVMARRILHYAMNEVAGLYPHPQELWHFGRGDPLSEYVSNKIGRPITAYYGIPPVPDDYQKEMQRLQADLAAE